MKRICVLLSITLLSVAAACSRTAPRETKLTDLEEFAIQIVDRTVYVRDEETNLLFVVSDITPPMHNSKQYAVNVLRFGRIIDIPEHKIIKLRSR